MPADAATEHGAEVKGTKEKRGDAMFFCICFPVTEAAVAAIMDLRTGKVDNGWILFCMVVETFVCFFQEGPEGMKRLIAGMILPVVMFVPLFLFHMIGAGDIKLFSAIGGVMGAEKIFRCVIWALICGAGISLAILILNGDAFSRLRYLREYIREFWQTGKIKPYYKGNVEAPENFHFTIPVFMSVVLYAGGVY